MLDQERVIDAGFLEYARLGVLAEDDPDLVRSLDVVDATLLRSTDTGDGLFRYVHVPGGSPTSTAASFPQDGFSRDQARGFTPTPQGFQFGVCATASLDPHCTFPAGQVPKAIDVLVPPGVAQGDELDYTVHNPVAIAPVVVP